MTYGKGEKDPSLAERVNFDTFDSLFLNGKIHPAAILQGWFLDTLPFIEELIENIDPGVTSNTRIAHPIPIYNRETNQFEQLIYPCIPDSLPKTFEEISFDNFTTFVKNPPKYANEFKILDRYSYFLNTRSILNTFSQNPNNDLITAFQNTSGFYTGFVTSMLRQDLIYGPIIKIRALVKDKLPISNKAPLKIIDSALRSPYYLFLELRRFVDAFSWRQNEIEVVKRIIEKNSIDFTYTFENLLARHKKLASQYQLNILSTWL